MNLVARSSCRSLAVALAVAMVFTPTGARARAIDEPAVPGDRAAGTAATGEGEAATSKVPLSNDPALEYKLGTQAYALGNYEQAIAHFERSYALSNHPYLLYNLGLAYTQWHGLSGDVDHLRKARRLFQNYLKALADDPKMDQEQRDDAEAQIAKIDEDLAQIAARTPAATPAEGPSEAASAPSTRGTDAPPPTKQPVYKRGWFWGVIAVGVLAVGAGVTAGVLASRRDDKNPAELGNIGPLQGSAPTGLGLRF
ncbi:tetratricopeptide repeat protein [Nannocystis radixulma]|uniref:Tetratricopeptide repeat protein n=1 Tax=Nannocystis radixulma TaxID=2995305 RepID=A0ABT5AWE3_9BACT|nr:tetratricopeptide repeat protein [Nannocystis radixulma]MDC0666131.1 tetratricopeptide repeat protein [Nannocystis radixulma]